MFYNNGNIYNGELINDLREANGIMKYNNGEKYDVYWKNNLREGESKICFLKDIIK
jgi:hypothetical protein